MEITKERKDNYTILKINAEKLDSFLSPALKAEFVVLSKEGVNRFLVDLTDVKYCDSSGLSALLVGNRLCNETNGKFVLSNMQEMVVKLIEISQLNKILNITNDLQSADKLLA
ncbi:MAG: STAS domain-containing protein [Flavobacteriales bacterium]